MSTIQELMAAINTAKKEIEDQIMLLENYKTSIDKHVQKVIDALEGSPDGRDVTMKNNFETTKENINKAVTQLNIAKAQLESIRLM